MFSLQKQVRNQGGEIIYFKSGEPMDKVRNISEITALLRFRT